MASSWKEQKEAFVTGHQGTTPAEVFGICAGAVVGVWLDAVLPGVPSAAQSGALLRQGILVWLPMILLQSNRVYPWGIAYVGLQALLILVCHVRAARQTEAPSVISQQQNRQQQQRPHHGGLAHYRSLLLSLTFVAILAVDFPLFPRRLAKTETAGYALMDVGAASFSISGGLVSARGRGRPRPGWSRELRRILPLLFMGSLRLLTHQELDYPEHNSEYGVHWNFFYTLAVIGPLTAVLPGPSWTTPAIIMSVYQYALSYHGGQGLVEDAPRACTASDSHPLCHLVMANREGILGCLGYASLYLLSEWIAHYVLWRTKHASTTSSAAGTSTIRLLVYVTVVVIFLWQFVVVGLGVPVSRRSTNLPFCLWALVVNLPLLTVLLWVDQRHGARVSRVAHLLSRHSLVCFIVANLLTGLVNLSISTLDVSDGAAVVILVTYMSAIGMVAMLVESLVVSKAAARVEGFATKDA
jgi:phosphatidylinositol glycan class W